MWRSRGPQPAKACNRQSTSFTETHTVVSGNSVKIGPLHADLAAKCNITARRVGAARQVSRVCLRRLPAQLPVPGTPEHRFAHRFEIQSKSVVRGYKFKRLKLHKFKCLNLPASPPAQRRAPAPPTRHPRGPHRAAPPPAGRRELAKLCVKIGGVGKHKLCPYQWPRQARRPACAALHRDLRSARGVEQVCVHSGGLIADG